MYVHVMYYVQLCCKGRCVLLQIRAGCKMCLLLKVRLQSEVMCSWRQKTFICGAIWCQVSATNIKLIKICLK